jgi:2-amino-4-hydroxy-6-hydroxymethyldihydropteridine diphosphokinase
MNTAYLLTGGNIGNRVAYLQQAAELIADLAGKITAVSAIYETAAWGQKDQNSFLNQVLEVRTALTPEDLMTILLQIEEKMGRKRMDRYGPRIIDIDILLYGNEIHNSSHITIPHPELANRRFALVPLSELAASYLHPVTGKSIEQMLAETTDPLPVQKF